MNWVHVCKFKRSDKSKWEFGFYINESVILDRFGSRIMEVWDIVNYSNLGAFVLPVDDE